MMKSKNLWKIIVVVLVLALGIVGYIYYDYFFHPLKWTYKNLYSAVKSKNTDRIRKVMSKNSLALAEFAAGQQKQPVEEVLRNGFTATTFADSVPDMRDERVKDEFGALEVWNSKDKLWEDLPFIMEDGEWKFAIGDMFKGSYQKPAPGMAIKEQEAANANNPNLIPAAPPMNLNSAMPANSNSNVKVNTVQVEPIKPVKREQPKKE
jgi:hypothetical protein